MGDVYRAVDTNLGRLVAIKILSERHRDNDELRGRFVREARAVAATSHPNVVQVFTTGAFDDKPYLAMELLDGIDLATSVDRGGPWTSLPTARAILDTARGLEAAATAGLIHRDVKPSNLMWLTDGSVKVTDFGLAKPLDPGDDPTLTAMGVVVGTPDYIAPEQARGDAIDARVDIYALGGTTYFMLTGQPPFRTGNASEDQYLKVVARHLRNPAPIASESVPGTDPELSQLAVDMMAKKRDERPSFPYIVEKLQRVVARLEAAGASGAIPYTEQAAGKSGASPTPFVGQPAASAPSEDASHSDSALTMIRKPPSKQTPSASATPSEPMIAPAPTSRPLVVVTVLAALIFIVGLGLLLFGPIPKNTQEGPNATADAAPAPMPDAAPPIPVPPAGMLLVSHPDGTPWFFVGAHTVTAGELADVFPSKRKLSKAAAAKPATKVSYDRATKYAKAEQARLLTADEWTAAAAVEGFEPTPRRMWEWTSELESKRKRTVRATPDKTAQRKPTAQKNITFRIARPLL